MLLDSGCTGSCIDQNFIQNNRINTENLPIPLLVYNTNRTENSAGAITEMARLHVKIKDHVEILELAITELGRTSVFIGHEWLKKHNP